MFARFSECMKRWMCMSTSKLQNINENSKSLSLACCNLLAGVWKKKRHSSDCWNPFLPVCVVAVALYALTLVGKQPICWNPSPRFLPPLVPTEERKRKPTMSHILFVSLLLCRTGELKLSTFTWRYRKLLFESAPLEDMRWNCEQPPDLESSADLTMKSWSTRKNPSWRDKILIIILKKTLFSHSG